MSDTLEVQDSKITKKKLYDYQIADLKRIFEVFDSAPDNYNLLYQLPTGGGKTVIFSEIVRQYINKHKKKVKKLQTGKQNLRSSMISVRPLTL